jgi:hypothetical protein
VGPRAGLDGYGKSRPPQGFDPRTLQPVASSCTDYAIPAHPQTYRMLNFIVGSFGLDSMFLTEGGILDPCYELCE